MPEGYLGLQFLIQRNGARPPPPDLLPDRSFLGLGGRLELPELSNGELIAAWLSPRVFDAVIPALEVSSENPVVLFTQLRFPESAVTGAARTVVGRCGPLLLWLTGELRG